MNVDGTFDACEELMHYVYALEALLANDIDCDSLYELVLSDDETSSKGCEKISAITQDGLTLKQLLEHLRYAFLDEHSTCPVILAYLNQAEEDELLGVLKRHKYTLGLSIFDIKGISLTSYIHKILTNEDCKPPIEHQRGFNPTMKEVVCAEVLKLLNFGIIYAISNSQWVSSIQVVPENSGMTMVRNDKDELIPL